MKLYFHFSCLVDGALISRATSTPYNMDDFTLLSKGVYRERLIFDVRITEW